MVSVQQRLPGVPVYFQVFAGTTLYCLGVNNLCYVSGVAVALCLGKTNTKLKSSVQSIDKVLSSNTAPQSLLVDKPLKSAMLVCLKRKIHKIK